MPRYFFDLQDGRRIPDFGGMELRDIHAAKAEAERLSQAFTTDGSESSPSVERWQVEVTDEWGLLLFRLPFAASAGLDPKQKN